MYIRAHTFNVSYTDALGSDAGDVGAARSVPRERGGRKNRVNRCRRHAPRLVVAPGRRGTYPENRSGFRETVPGPFAPRDPLRGNSPFTCYHRHILFIHRAHRAAHRSPGRSLARSLARSRRLQRQVTALPPIELDGSSGEDQTRDEETETYRRDQDQVPRHTTRRNKTRSTQCHRRCAGQFAPPRPRQ